MRCGGGITRADREDARRYASKIRSELGAPGPSTDLVTRVRTHLSWVDVTLEPLAAADGRQDAFMFPRRRGGFAIVVDPRSSPRDRDSASRLSFRVAHEIGHTYFFDRGRPARRLKAWTDDEELWADYFATQLLSSLAQ